MSGTAYGTVILHVSPESYIGGPLALVRDAVPDSRRLFEDFVDFIATRAQDRSLTRAAASASAIPIRPLERLPMKRTVSIGSRVPPAVTRMRSPARSRRLDAPPETIRWRDWSAAAHADYHANREPTPIAPLRRPKTMFSPPW